MSTFKRLPTPCVMTCFSVEIIVSKVMKIRGHGRACCSFRSLPQLHFDGSTMLAVTTFQQRCPFCRGNFRLRRLFNCSIFLSNSIFLVVVKFIVQNTSFVVMLEEYFTLRENWAHEEGLLSRNFSTINQRHSCTCI